MKDIVTERREADTPQGCEFARRLETMPPDHAADELFDMYSLCWDDDLAEEITCELGVRFEAAKLTAAEIIRKRPQPRPVLDGDDDFLSGYLIPEGSVDDERRVLQNTILLVSSSVESGRDDRSGRFYQDDADQSWNAAAVPNDRGRKNIPVACLRADPTMAG